MSRSVPSASSNLCSKYKENRAASRSSTIGYSQEEIIRSPLRDRRSQMGNEKKDRRSSKPRASQVQKTYTQNNRDSNVKSNRLQNTSDYNRGIRYADKKPESRKENLPVSTSSRNTLRVEEMYRLHRLGRVANSSTLPKHPQMDPSSDLQDHRQHHRKPDPPDTIGSSNTTNLLQTLLKKVSDIERTVTKNDRRFVEYERRLTRLEVTVNKTFIVLGDVSNAINTRALIGNTSFFRDDKPPKGFQAPKLPIKRLRDLIFVNEHLENKDYFNYFVSSSQGNFLANSQSLFTNSERLKSDSVP